jgi:hypothetical protein
MKSTTSVTMALTATMIFFLTACKVFPGNGEHYESYDPSKSYKLVLAPDSGAKYSFTVNNETSIKTDYEDKKTENVNRTTNAVSYLIGKDSVGNFLFHITYDSVHIYTKNKDTENDLDMANAQTSLDFVEKMLGILKSANITAIISPKGEVKQVNGYDEMTAKIMAAFSGADNRTKDLAMQKWRQMIDQGIIKKNMEQLFTIFPDSAIKIGAQWKLTSHQNSDIGINLKSIYTLKEMNSHFTLIESEGKMLSDTNVVDVMGYNVMAKLQGSQESEYQLETSTGMLISSSVKAHFEGTLEVLGKEVPIDIQTSVIIEGKKTK